MMHDTEPMLKKKTLSGPLNVLGHNWTMFIFFSDECMRNNNSEYCDDNNIMNDPGYIACTDSERSMSDCSCDDVMNEVRA